MTGIVLRKAVMHTDLDDVYKMMTGEDQYLFSVRIGVNSEQQFKDWFCERLRCDFHDFYIIADENSGQTIGYVHNYDFSLHNGHCKVVVYIKAQYRDSGIGGFAAIRFMDMLLMRYPLRKLYTAVYDYNQCSLTNNIKAGFTQEGSLEQYRYYDGQYHSLHLLSIDRESFYQKFGGVLHP